MVDGWELVTRGRSGSVVQRSADGLTYTKTERTQSTIPGLRKERDRLEWLRTVSIDAPAVLDWNESNDAATLVTSALPGVPVSELATGDAVRAVESLVEYLRHLHALPVLECPFDRRLRVTVPEAATNVNAGLVDETDFDEPHLGREAEDLLAELLAGREKAESLEGAELAVCHGDFCLPNVFVDPASLRVTGILDVGRLGVADRHVDLALLTRSIGCTSLNPNYGPTLAALVLSATDADPGRIEYYRLLDEFF